MQKYTFRVEGQWEIISVPDLSHQAVYKTIYNL